MFPEADDVDYNSDSDYEYEDSYSKKKSKGGKKPKGKGVRKMSQRIGQLHLFTNELSSKDSKFRGSGLGGNSSKRRSTADIIPESEKPYHCDCKSNSSFFF